jgi:hypothetical protein
MGGSRWPDQPEGFSRPIHLAAEPGWIPWHASSSSRSRRTTWPASVRAVVHADKLDDLGTGPLRWVGRVVGTHRSHLVAVRSSRCGVGGGPAPRGWQCVRRRAGQRCMVGMAERPEEFGAGWCRRDDGGRGRLRGCRGVEGRRCSGKARTVDRVRARHGNRSVVVSPEGEIVRCVMAFDPFGGWERSTSTTTPRAPDAQHPRVRPIAHQSVHCMVRRHRLRRTSLVSVDACGATSSSSMCRRSRSSFGRS